MEREFEDIYNKIYNENEISKIENLSNKRGLNVLKLFGIMIIGMFISPYTLLVTLPVLLIYVFKTSNGKPKEQEDEQKKLYKEKLILPLMQEVFKDVQYKPDQGMSLDKYLEAEYEDKGLNELEEYDSNDHIIFPMQIDGKNIGKLEIYDVKLKKDGDDTRTIRVFAGLTGSILLPKNIESKIKLISNVINMNFTNLSQNQNILYTDSSEFEKYFNILAQDKILAMRIFTPDIMEKIINIYKTNKNRFDINIINNRLYVRVYCMGAFESKIVIGGEKYESVKKDFIALDTIRELVCLIYKIIDSIEI